MGNGIGKRATRRAAVGYPILRVAFRFGPNELDSHPASGRSSAPGEMKRIMPDRANDLRLVSRAECQRFTGRTNYEKYVSGGCVCERNVFLIIHAGGLAAPSAGGSTGGAGGGAGASAGGAGGAGGASLVLKNASSSANDPSGALPARASVESLGRVLGLP